MMIESTILPHVALLCFAGLSFAAGISDICSYTIPNRYSLAIALVYPAHILLAAQPVDWLGALITFGSAMAVGFLLYSFRLIGGGDAKFFAVVALWAGPALIMEFTLYTTLFGGVVAVFLLLKHRLDRAVTPEMALYTPSDPGFSKQLMPYGTAIAAGALYVAFTLIKVS